MCRYDCQTSTCLCASLPQYLRNSLVHIAASRPKENPVAACLLGPKPPVCCDRLDSQRLACFIAGRKPPGPQLAFTNLVVFVSFTPSYTRLPLLSNDVLCLCGGQRLGFAKDKVHFYVALCTTVVCDEWRRVKRPWLVLTQTRP